MNSYEEFLQAIEELYDQNKLDSNNDFIDRNVELMYRQRKLACEQMNKKFGWNVKVVNLNEEAKENQKLELEKEDNKNE